MTPGLLAVWAAAFNAALSKGIENAPPSVLVPGQEKAWEEYEEQVTASACEAASHAVDHLLGVRAHLREGYGAASLVYRRWADVTGRHGW